MPAAVPADAVRGQCHAGILAVARPGPEKERTALTQVLIPVAMRTIVALSLALGTAAVWAADASDAAAPPQPAASAEVVPGTETTASTPAASLGKAPATAPQRVEKVEGAIGLLVHHSPTYPGAGDFETKFNPAGFIRYGRITISGAGGFTTKRKDDVERGLDAELVRRSNLRASVALRFDNGRKETDSPYLAGMGKIRKTVRARIGVRYDVDQNWQLTVATSIDVLGHGGGASGELSIGRSWRLTPATVWIMGGGLSVGNGRYMRAWHGVSEEQSAASGYPVYTPSAGLRGMNVTGTLRSEFAHRWAGFAGIAYTRTLGAAAASPLSRGVNAVTFNGGVAWRF
jgi:outer membrane scaffolding protein for murein synthesis (MipA/OmpV family)